MSDGTFLSRVAAWEMERARLESEPRNAKHHIVRMKVSNREGIALFREAQVALHEFALALQASVDLINELKGNHGSEESPEAEDS